MAHLIARFAAKSRELLELVQKKRQRRNDDLENEIRIARARRAEMLGDSSRGAGRKVASLCARLRGRQGAAATGQIAIPAAGPNRTPGDVSPESGAETPIGLPELFLRVCGYPLSRFLLPRTSVRRQKQTTRSGTFFDLV